MAKKVTKEQALAAMSQYAQESANIKEIIGRKQVEMSEINDQYEDLLSEPTTIIEKSKDLIERYVNENKTELFSEKSKTATLGVGEVSIRQSSPKLGFLKGYDTAKVLDKIKRKYKDTLEMFVRTKEDLDKTSLKKLGDRDLKMIGMEKTSEELISIKVTPTVKA